jgi:hypothetical protein
MGGYKKMKRALRPGWILALGDFAMFMLFTWIGMREHRLGLTLYGTAMTALPLMLGWLVSGLAAGAFRPAVYSGYRRGALAILRVWIIALPAGLVFRLLLYGKPIFTVFGVLAFVFIYLFLVVWRFAFIWLLKQINPRA